MHINRGSSNSSLTTTLRLECYTTSKFNSITTHSIHSSGRVNLNIYNSQQHCLPSKISIALNCNAAVERCRVNVITDRLDTTTDMAPKRRSNERPSRIPIPQPIHSAASWMEGTVEDAWSLRERHNDQMITR